LPWTLFAAAITTASSSLIDNMHLVTKVYFPREIFPLSAICAKFVDFLVASTIFVGLLIYYRVAIAWTWVWIPLILIMQLLLIVGLSLLSAAVTVFYRDVRHAIVLIMQIWMYATPIIYPLSMVPEKLRPYLVLNPMVGIIESYRHVLLYGQYPPMTLLCSSAVLSIFLFLVGTWYFRRVHWQFGDVI
jgi:lipopolysaccharide transport system permease protein